MACGMAVAHINELPVACSYMHKTFTGQLNNVARAGEGPLRDLLQLMESMCLEEGGGLQLAAHAGAHDLTPTHVWTTVGSVLTQKAVSKAMSCSPIRSSSNTAPFVLTCPLSADVHHPDPASSLTPTLCSSIPLVHPRPPKRRWVPPLSP